MRTLQPGGTSESENMTWDAASGSVYGQRVNRRPAPQVLGLRKFLRLVRADSDGGRCGRDRVCRPDPSQTYQLLTHNERPNEDP
jgi:hypothetical protein